MEVNQKRTIQKRLNALILGALAIAFAPIFVRLSETGPSATAFWRLALALPLLYTWMVMEEKAKPGSRRPSSRSDYVRLTVAGLFFAGDLAVWHWSIKFTTVANATLLANFAPIFVALGGWLLFRQKVTAAFIGGMIVAVMGMVLLVGGGVEVNSQHLLGDFLGIVTAVFYGGYILAVKKLRAEFSTATIMTWSGIITSLVLLPVIYFSHETILPVSSKGWLVVLGLAFVSQFGGQSLITYALAILPAAFSSVALLVQPVMATVFAWLLLGEQIGFLQAMGGLVALLGIYAARRASRLE